MLVVAPWVSPIQGADFLIKQCQDPMIIDLVTPSEESGEQISEESPEQMQLDSPFVTPERSTSQVQLGRFASTPPQPTPPADRYAGDTVMESIEQPAPRRRRVSLNVSCFNLAAMRESDVLWPIYRTQRL